MTFMLKCPPVFKSFLASQQMEAETCTATHAGIPTSDVRHGADFKNYYAVIIAPTFISNQCTALSKLPSLSISIRPAFVGWLHVEIQPTSSPQVQF